MDIKELILHYLSVYDGRSKPTKSRIEQDIVLKCNKKDYYKIYSYMIECFDILKSEGKIRLIPYSEMTMKQQRTYDEDLDPIYEIIKK